jgi:hypothetical protein
MANPEHLLILRTQDVMAWNAWRDQHRGLRPDLSTANFRGYNLDGANFCGANLDGANLINAHLSGADLRVANLCEASLINADLRGADLTGANLCWANLHGADLTGATLSHATLFATVFGSTDLTAVLGLESCEHHGPSTLDHRTILRSGMLPLTFLRGCGLPEQLIKSLQSLLNEPIKYHSCFISYASKDYAFAARLYADLWRKGVDCWFASKNMKIGDQLRRQIDEMIRAHEKVIVILSKHSVVSQWVEQEVETALAREREQKTPTLFPIRIDNTVMTLKKGWPALIHNTRDIGDFRRWKTTYGVYQKAFDGLLHDLKVVERKSEG